MSIFKGKTVVNRAEKIADFTIATAEYGSAVPEIIGTTRISGNIIYYDDFTAHEHKETQRSGKGGGSKTVSITYTYTVAIIFALCEGAIKGLGKVWKNKDIYNYPSDEIGMTLYYGTNEQQPWPYVVGKHPEKALPYKGLAYMAGVIDLGSNASLPNFNFEVKGKLTEGGDGVDVNPADYILYILNKIGMGDVKISGIENYRRYCAAADLLISTPMDESKSRTAREIVNEIATITNAFMFWSNDQFKIVPLADRAIGSWEPNRTIMYDLTPDDFLPQSNGACVTYARKDSSEIYNRFTVEFINRANGYEKESVSYVDSDDLKEYGLRQASTTKALYIYTKKRAVFLAEELARKNKYERNQYTFKLDWAFCRLEVGDLVTLTDPSIGLNKQVALIDSVTEDAQGLLTFTAISRAGGDYDAAIYDVHDTDRPFVDFSPEPGDVDVPAIFQPPTELTSNGNELWIGAKGKNKNWGGCNVWVSDDNQHYSEVGKITNSARLGSLAAAANASADEIEVTVNGTLLSGTEQDAQRANTLCWLDGECLSYTTATMLQNGNYKLSGLIRGQYSTTAAAHTAGAKFVRCDETLLKSPLKKDDVGKKLWIKFTSYNIFGAREQSLADVEPYEYTILPYYIPPVLSVTAHNRYRELQDGVSRYDIVVDWTPPDFANYLQGDVWYKTSNSQSDAIVLAEGVPADRLGYNGPWIFGGAGKNQVVIPQAIVGDSYLIAVCTKDEYGVSNSPDMAPQTEILVALKTNIPNTPDGFGITFGDAVILSWEEVINADVFFYEVRYDQNPGAEDANLIARTNGTSATVTLNVRTGTLYLYAKSAVGKYSTPAVLKYNKALPPKPTLLSATARLGGMSIIAGNVPSGCNGVNFYIDESILIQSKNTTVTHSCEAGIHSVAATYTDIFGEGPKSDSINCTVKIKVDNSMLEDEAISIGKVDQKLKGELERIHTNAKNLTELGNSLQTLSEQTFERIHTNAKNLTELGNSLQTLSEQTNENFSRIDNDIGGITTTVSKHGNSISQLQQKADSITTTVSKHGNSISQLQQNADSITLTVSKHGNSISQLQQKADSITTTVSKHSDSISQLQQNADSITLTVQSNKNNQDKINEQITSSVKQNADSITSIVTKLNGKAEDCSYSAITQLRDSINLRVKSEDIINQINLSKEGVKIDGKYIHITGETVFDNNIISKAMLQANSVSADKLAAETISLGGALKVVGGAVTLSGDGLKVAETDGSYTMFDYSGISFFDEYGKKYAMVKKQIIGTAQDGQYVKFTNPWKYVPKVICTPIDLASYVDAYDGFNTVVQCFAYDITNKGFYVRCRSILTADTSGGEILINKTINGGYIENEKLVPNNSYNIPIKLPKNIDITINMTAMAYGTYEHVKKFDAYLNKWIEYDIKAKTGIRVKLLVNNQLVATSQDVETTEYQSKTVELSLNASNIPDGALITLYTEVWLITGNSTFGPSYCTLNIKTITSNMAIETIASTGRASFIALENSDEGYTVMDQSEVTT